MSVKVTALTDVKIKASLTSESEEEVFFLLKGDSKTGITFIHAVCSAWEKFSDDPISIPETPGETILYKNLIGVEKHT